HTASRRCAVPGVRIFLSNREFRVSTSPAGYDQHFSYAIQGVIDGTASLEVDLAQARKGTKYVIGGAGERSILTYRHCQSSADCGDRRICSLRWVRGLCVHVALEPDLVTRSSGGQYFAACCRFSNAFTPVTARID